MYKVLIVDDEKIVRIALKTLIRWEQYGFIVAGGAADGISALSMAQKFSPDIIITDLKMPRMDGITLIKKLKETGYSGKILVLSNYGEFELVREAMKLGVYDYILKLTLKSDEFIEMMKKIAAEIDEDRLKNERVLSEKIKLNESRQALKALFFKELLLEEEYDEREVSKKARVLDIDAAPVRCRMLYILLEHAVDPAVTGLHQDRQLLAFSVSNIMSEIIGQKPGLEIVELNPDRFAVIIPSSENGTSGEKVFQAAVNISRSVQTYLNITLSIVVGGEFAGFCQMREMFRKCLEYANIRFYTGFGSIIGTEQGLSTGSLSSLKSRLEKTGEGLRRSLEFGEFEEACTAMDQFLCLAAEECFDPVELKRLTAEMLVETEKALLERGSETNRNIQAAADAMMKSETLERFKAEAVKLIKELHAGIEVEKKQKHRKEIALIIDYLKSSLGEKVTLSMIAKQVNLNESYLCRMFKRETGQNLMNFLSTLRMEKAGELLKLPDAAIKEVSSAVGIGDPFYFSKLFTKHYGVSPTDYKKKVLGRNH